MTFWEESQIKALERAAYICMVDSVLQPTLKRLEADSKAGTLSKRELMVVKFLAQRGVPIALKILQKHRDQTPRADKATPRKLKRLDTVLAELKCTTDSEKALRLVRKLTPEEREELRVLQEKRAANGVGISVGRRMVEKHRNNLPAQPANVAKSFKSVLGVGDNRATRSHECSRESR